MRTCQSLAAQPWSPARGCQMKVPYAELQRVGPYICFTQVTSMHSPTLTSWHFERLQSQHMFRVKRFAYFWERALTWLTQAPAKIRENSTQPVITVSSCCHARSSFTNGASMLAEIKAIGCRLHSLRLDEGWDSELSGLCMGMTGLVPEAMEPPHTQCLCLLASLESNPRALKTNEPHLCMGRPCLSSGDFVRLRLPTKASSPKDRRPSSWRWLAASSGLGAAALPPSLSRLLANGFPMGKEPVGKKGLAHRKNGAKWAPKPLWISFFGEAYVLLET